MDFESQIEKIAKDIRDREDNAIAMEFTKCIAEMLKKNGVAPKITEYINENVKENSIEHRYGVTIDELDFSEHDKRFRDEIRQLKHELQKKCSFETDRLVKLPFDPLETANMLINAKYRRKANGIDRLRGCEEDTIETDMYSVNDLEQIAEHLLVYCKHNREDE